VFELVIAAFYWIAQ